MLGDVRCAVGMRGAEALFSYVSCEAPGADRIIRCGRSSKIVNEALTALSGEFEKLYAKLGRPSIPPEKLLRALLLQAFYSVRSERQLMEQLDYNLLFRWFVGLSLDAVIWDVTVFTKNRERLIEGDIASKFMAAVLNQERVKALLSDDHFSVDGTLIEAWASMKSFRPKDGSGAPPAPRAQREAGLPRREAPQPDPRLGHRSRCPVVSQGTGPAGQARLSGARCDGEPACSGGRHASDPGNRHGRARGRAGDGGGSSRQSPDHAGCRQEPALAKAGAYDVAGFVADLRQDNVTPHVAQNTTNRRSAIDGRTTRHPGYAVSGRVRKRIEEVFGWTKAAAGFRKTRHRGLARVGWMFTLTATAYNLVRLPKLVGAAA